MQEKTISLDELKKIQLDILEEVHNFCKKQNITYALGWGTLLGAIRHNGYIPWDDDIDLIMPREDYERFLSSFGTERYCVKSRRNDKRYYLPFAKVIDTNTVLIEDSSVHCSIGVYIDLIPMDFLPTDAIVRKHLMQKTSILSRIHLYKLVTLKYQTTFSRHFLHFATKLLSCFISLNALADVIERVAMDRRFPVGDEITALVEIRYPERYIMPYDTCFDVCTHCFEGKFFFIPKQYDRCLTSWYGDYMKLPPIEKRISNHVFKAYWKEIDNSGGAGTA